MMPENCRNVIAVALQIWIINIMLKHMKLTTIGAIALFLLASSGTLSAELGKASWYAMTTQTANGEWASPNSMTAAHRSLEFGTNVKVTNLRNGRAIVVCINDRGPFIAGRIIDVTKEGARRLGFLKSGWTQVRVEVKGRKSRRCT